jgi:hypothetical protein
MFKGCTEDHYNLNTFYPRKIDCQRYGRYCLFTYNGAYTMPHPTQRQQVGGTYSTLPAIGLWKSSTSQEAQLLQQGTQLTKLQIQ